MRRKIEKIGKQLRMKAQSEAALFCDEETEVKGINIPKMHMLYLALYLSREDKLMEFIEAAESDCESVLDRRYGSMPKSYVRKKQQTK